jgi:predicted DCC family thiol-disulfide oxidoreductase YuxK
MDQQRLNNIIFFDGVCGLCNGFIDFVLAVDKSEKYRFSPLQSESAHRLLPSEITQNLTSVVLYQNGKIFTKSEAVIRVLHGMGGIWKIAIIGNILPARLRNRTYDWVAKHRYRFFGKKETCRLPQPEERSRFVI